jgi:hypothetical protein
MNLLMAATVAFLRVIDNGENGYFAFIEDAIKGKADMDNGSVSPFFGQPLDD